MAQEQKLKVFLDTSALIAGISSSRGAARAVLQLAEIGLIELLISRQVVVEADRTIEAKLPEMTDEYRAYINAIAPFLVDDPSRREIEAFANLIDPDDAPILAAASLSGADYLVTWDKKHFINKREQISSSPKIVTPGEFLKDFRRHTEK